MVGAPDLTLVGVLLLPRVTVDDAVLLVPADLVAVHVLELW